MGEKIVDGVRTSRSTEERKFNPDAFDDDDDEDDGFEDEEEEEEEKKK